jgi:AraC family transcriptional regulator
MKADRLPIRVGWPYTSAYEHSSIMVWKAGGNLTGECALDSKMTGVRPDPSVAPVVKHLLQSAGQALAPEQTSARRLIDQAIALLNQEPAEAALRPGGSASFGGLAPWQVRRVSDYIDTHLASPLPMAKLSTVANLSTWYFCHAFKRRLGMSPHTYVMRKRVEKAQELMLATDEPLAQIASSCGLASQSHLCQVFRRATGYTPSAWRRHYRMGGGKSSRDHFRALALSSHRRTVAHRLCLIGDDVTAPRCHSDF